MKNTTLMESLATVIHSVHVTTNELKDSRRYWKSTYYRNEDL